MVKLGCQVSAVVTTRLMFYFQYIHLQKEETGKAFSKRDYRNIFFTESPKVAFAASLGGNGLVKTTSGNKDLIYREVLTNVGGAYNANTGEIKI